LSHNSQFGCLVSNSRHRTNTIFVEVAAMSTETINGSPLIKNMGFVLKLLLTGVEGEFA
jgi:hypothetical protein